MPRLACTLLGGALFAVAAAAQDPPPQPPAPPPPAAQLLPRLALQPALAKAKAGKAAAGPEALPPGAIARLGTALPRRETAPAQVGAVAYSPDGRLVATADSVVRLWDAGTGRELRAFPAQAPPAAAGAVALVAATSNVRPTALAFSPDGAQVAAMNYTQIAVWETASGRPIACWRPLGNERFMSPAISLAYTAEGKELAAILYSQTTRGFAVGMWEAATGKDRRTIPLVASTSTLTAGALGVAPDGRTLAVALSGHPIQIVELATGRVRDEVTVDTPAPRPAVNTVVSRDPQTVRFAPDGRTLYTVGEEGEIVARDLVAGRERRFGSAQAGTQLHVSADGKWLAVRAADGTVRVYDAGTGRPRSRLGDPPPATRVAAPAPFALSPDGETVAIVDTHGLRLYDAATGRDRSPPTGHAAAVMSLTFVPDGSSLVSLGTDKVLTWDTAQKAVTGARVPDADRGVRAVSADGKWLAECRFDGHVRVVELATGRVIREFDAGKRLAFMAFAPDRKALVGAEAGPVQADADPRPVRRWDLTTGQALPPLDPGVAPTLRLVFAPGGTRLVGTDTAGGARVWDWPSGKLLWQAPPLAGVMVGAGAAAFSPDGGRLALASARGPVRLFDAATGEPAGDLDGHGGSTLAVAFAPDGRTIATGGSDGLVRIWDADTGLPQHRRAGHHGNVYALAYSPNGALLASGGEDASILVWDAPALGRRATAAAPTGPDLSPEQVNKLWDDLAAPDAKTGYRALRSLAASPGTSLPRLKELIPPAAPADANKLAELLADLDHNQYARRQKASEGLAALGVAARSALKKHLAAATSAEVRQRLEDLLKRLDHPELTGEDLRLARAVEAVERAGTPEARALLEEWAEGDPNARLTQDAKAALERQKK